MKNITRRILLLLCVIMANACLDKNNSTPTISINASFPEETKVALAEMTNEAGMSLSWETTDRLKVVGQTEEWFTPKSIDGKQATFTGTMVEGERFDIILSEMENHLTRNYLEQIQEDIASVSHLQYDACLSGVNSYTNISFTDEWAESAGGKLFQSGCLLLHFQLPVAARNIYKVYLKASKSIFNSGNAADSPKSSLLSLTFNNSDIGEAKEVKAYFMTSMQESVIDTQTQLSISIETDMGTYIKKITPGNISIEPGKLNKIKLNSNNWLPIAEYKELTVMSYNVGRFNKSYASLGYYTYPEVAKVIAEVGADLVGLNEVDRKIDNTEDASTYVQQDQKVIGLLGTGWNSHFIPAENEDYGSAALYSSKMKVVKIWPPVILEKYTGAETRSMGIIEFDDVVFCVTHLDQMYNLARVRAVSVINEWVRTHYPDCNKPIIILGDMNCKPTEQPITMFGYYWDLISPNTFTYPSSLPEKCIDYIFIWKNPFGYEIIENGTVSNFADIDISTISDHLPIYSTIRYLKRYPENDEIATPTQPGLDRIPDNFIYSEEF